MPALVVDICSAPVRRTEGDAVKATKKLKALSVCAAVVGVGVIGGTLTGFVPADAATVNATDAVAAVQRVAPEAVSNVANATSDTDTAVQASVSGVEVSVPEDASDGVTASSGGADLTIGLPFADQATGATDSQKAGVVVYDNNNGSSTVPVVHEDGRVQISTVIENADAPGRYDYPITVPDGQSLQIAPDGSAFVGSNDGSTATISAVIAKPWARDGEGNTIPTHYEVEGSTLTQVVDFTESTVFPVVADPSVTFGVYIVVKVSQATAQAIHAGSVGGAIAILSLTGPIGAIIGAAVFSTIGGYNATRISQCKNWAFSYTYLGQLVKSGCA